MQRNVPQSCASTTDHDSPVVRFARPSHARGLELVHYPNLGRGWRGIPETYTWFTMIDRLDGDVEVISRGVRVQCQVGSVTIGEPGEPYVLRPRSKMRGEFRVVRIDNDLLAALATEMGLRNSPGLFPREPQRDDALALAFARLYRAVDNGDRLAMQERLLAFLAAVFGPRPGALVSGGVSHSPGVRSAREHLHAFFDASLSLDELAHTAGMDKFALLRAFAREFGMTPHAYQVQLRMARARHLIAQNVPLADVALAVGYCEQSALHRPFKRLTASRPERTLALFVDALAVRGRHVINCADGVYLRGGG